THNNIKLVVIILLLEIEMMIQDLKEKISMKVQKTGLRYSLPFLNIFLVLIVIGIFRFKETNPCVKF
ncbi:MAG: hypothetical protein QW279_08500, partial [Candidatus Jordarchaeaceae archaeon]